MHTRIGIVGLLVALFVLVAPLAAQDNLVIPEGEPISAGETVEAALTGDAPVAAWTFEASEGDAFTAYVDDEEFTVPYYIFIANEAGELLMYTSGDNTFEHNTVIHAWFAPEDGTYTVGVVSSSNFLLNELEAELETEGGAPFTFTFAEAEFEEISLGDTVQGELTPENLVDVYVLRAERLDIPYVSMTTMQQGVTLGIDSAEDPERDPSSANTPAASTTQYISPFYVFRDEIYVFTVSASFLLDDELVEYTLDASSYEPAVLESGESAEVAIAIETLNNYLVFEGAADQTATITVTTPENMSVTTALIDPDGQPIAVDESGAGIEIELFEDGQYVVVVFPNSFLIEASELGAVEVALDLE